MAEQLERVAEGARNGNGACTKLAREMLAARRMLTALNNLVSAHDVQMLHGTVGYLLWKEASSAIAAAKGTDNA